MAEKGHNTTILLEVRPGTFSVISLSLSLSHTHTHTHTHTHAQTHTYPPLSVPVSLKEFSTQHTLWP